MSRYRITTNGRQLAGTPEPCGEEARTIANSVAAAHGVTFADLVAPRQGSKAASAARRQVMCDLWLTGRYSQSEIARFLNRKSATTVIWALDAKVAKPWAERKRAA